MKRQRKEYTREAFTESASHRVNMILKNLRLIHGMSHDYIEVMTLEDLNKMEKVLKKELSFTIRRMKGRLEAKEKTVFTFKDEEQ